MTFVLVDTSLEGWSDPIGKQSPHLSVKKFPQGGFEGFVVLQKKELVQIFSGLPPLHSYDHHNIEPISKHVKAQI